ncbi:MAG TPA: hypothetical protein VIL41_08295 [Coriobacteriia bacterium]
MTGATTSLIHHVNRRAQGDASLTVAFLALLLVPVPALLAAQSSGPAAHAGVAATLALLGVLLAATPAFALPPFVLGCGIGTLLHLVVTAPERFNAMEAERETDLQARSLVGCSLLVGGVFAATGLVAAIALFGAV